MTWFEPMGWVYRPVRAGGWLVTAAAFAFMAQVFLAIDARSHSVSDTFYGVFPFWAPTVLGWLWVAGRASPPRAT